jgi:GxxExxY protein
MANIEPIPAELDRIGTEIVDSAYRVHKALGPGLPESAYETCLVRELTKRGLEVNRQVHQPIVYDGVTIDAGFRLDLLVGGAVIVEVKALEDILPVHRSQLLTYLKLSGHRLGYLINFNVHLIKHGIKRMVL